MRLVQFYIPGKGKQVGVVEDGLVIDVTTEESPGVLELIQLACKTNTELEVLIAEKVEQVTGSSSPSGASSKISFTELDVSLNESKPHLLMPITPPEVWTCESTYKKVVDMRSADIPESDKSKNFYESVFSSERPCIILKATSSRCVGHNDYICMYARCSL